MSESKDGMVSAAWVSDLVSVAFGGAAPAAVSAWVDGAVCAPMLGNAKLGVTVQGGGGARVRVAASGESDRLIALAKSQAPACAAWLDKHAGAEFVFETDGTYLRIYGWGAKSEGDAVAQMWDNGDLVDIVPLQALPAGSWPGASELLAAVETTHLLAFRRDGVVDRVLWTWDGSSRDVDAAIAKLHVGGALTKIQAHYTDAGLHVAPYSVEWGPEGVTVCAWGAYMGKDVSDLPPMFADGAPDAATFAAELATTLPEAHVAEGEAFARDALYPALVAIRGEEVEYGDHLANVWRFLIGLLALEVPMDRLQVLRQVHAVNRLAALQGEAFELAKMSYAASHPDAPAPQGVREGFAGLDLSGIRDACRTRISEFNELAATAKADTEVDLHRFEAIAFEVATIRDLLDRALSGEFAAAEGPLHEYLVELGVTGYDDDPSLITLDNVDLDAESQDAAIEEALAMDLEDDDDF